MDSGIARGRVRTTIKYDDGHTPNNSLKETCSLGLPCAFLILDIHVMIKIDTCQNKVSADQYHVAISRAPVEVEVDH